jgi:hypothetical protein
LVLLGTLAVTGKAPEQQLAAENECGRESRKREGQEYVKRVAPAIHDSREQ